MSTNYRGYTWLDDSREYDENDERRAEALARRWSEITSAIEQEGFRRQAEYEDGSGYDPEPDRCDTCNGLGVVSLMGTAFDGDSPEEWNKGVNVLACPNPHCEDGYDMEWIRECEKKQRQHREDRDLELELIEDKLQAIGARMMRPYEHWNEDERYMEYQENRADYGY